MTADERDAFNAGVRAAIEPVLHWYQSDEQPERPVLDILADIVADLQDDRAELLRLTALLRPEAAPAPEPVAWLCEDLIMHGALSVTRDTEFAQARAEYRHNGEPAYRVTPLYAHPAPVCTATGPMSACPNRAITDTA